MDIFNAIDVNKTYGTQKVLNRVNLNIPEGSIYGLLGPNGAGKTTLLRIINRITAPDSGKLLFNGKEYHAKDLVRIGYLPEERGLYKKMKVGEQVLYLAQLKGLSKQEALKKLKYWFEKLEIQAWWNKKILELSKGMQQKVQFIVTLLHNPSLIIFDEPFTGFDPINTSLLKQEILELRQNGTSIIFSTHDMNSVEELCDYITLIDQGKCILEGPISDIRNAYKSNLYEISYAGEPKKIKQLLNKQYELVSEELKNGIITVKIKVPDSKNSNELILKVLSKIEITSFKEVLPSMNEIFIKSVQEKNQSFSSVTT